MRKIKTRHKIKFSDPTVLEVEAVVLARLGQSTDAIQRETGLTPCQIQYRLTKAKTAEGYKRGVSYRTKWRDGTSPEVKLVRNILLPGMRKEVCQTLAPVFVSDAGELPRKK